MKRYFFLLFLITPEKTLQSETPYCEGDAVFSKECRETLKQKKYEDIIGLDLDESSNGRSLSCQDEDGDCHKWLDLTRGEDMGVLQSIHFLDDDMKRPDIEFMIAKARNYLKYVHDESRFDCENMHKLCAFWAAGGECESNPTYMEENCAPVCTACEDWVFEDRCPMPEDPEALNIWKPGDLDKLFQKLASEPYKSEYSVEVLSSPPDGPWVITVDNIITEAEAKRFIELGYDLEYQRSTEAGDVKADGTVEKKISKGRTSTNAWCMDDCLDDDVTINVSERISNLTGIPDSHGEYIQLLRYEPTQFYKTHHDWIEYHLNRSYGVRILTFFLYLNEVEAGGGTNFDQLDLTVEPKLGRALLWPSTLNDNPDFIDERTTHQALPVESGIKYGANVWFHQRDIKAAAADGCLE